MYGKLFASSKCLGGHLHFGVRQLAVSFMYFPLKVSQQKQLNSCEILLPTCEGCTAEWRLISAIINNYYY